MWRQAIETKYLGPTNTKGTRIKATCNAKSIIISWDYSLDPEENHLKAAQALLNDLGWDKECNLVSGSIKSNKKGYVFVQVYKKFADK